MRTLVTQCLLHRICCEREAGVISVTAGNGPSPAGKGTGRVLTILKVEGGSTD